MKRPGIVGGIAFAFVMAVFAVPLWWGLSTTLSFSAAVRLCTLIPYLAYCCYLARTARIRVGILSLLVVNSVIGVGLACLPVTNSAVVAILAALLSLNRSLLFHRSLVSMALDGLVAFTGLLFAGYLFPETGSIAAALWGFFLAQAVFALIPPRLAGFFNAAEGEGVDPFLHGQRQAEAALERMVEQAR